MDEKQLREASNFGQSHMVLGGLERHVSARLAELNAREFTRRLWNKDASLWKAEPEHRRVIENALGWLTISGAMLDQVEEVRSFVGEIRRAGFTHAVLLGMGGSSLCPGVCRATFGTAPGYLDLEVLDSTVPASVARVARSVDLTRTLFLVSSKSGGTVETLSLYRHFRGRIERLKGDRAGEHFVAITDPGTSLERLARETGFRRVFHGHPDIGGRYSALSNFGIVPAALIGVDVRRLLERAEHMVRASAPHVSPSANPGVVLGAVLAEAARLGRDKVTFVASDGIETFADWAEQLIAESTGKEGRGLVPVAGEELAEPAAYGKDRLFVYLRLASDRAEGVERRLDKLAAAGHPIVRIGLASKIDLAQEFFRWEIATATMCALMGINAFDQPNVQESKEHTERLLEQFRARARLEEQPPVLKTEALHLYAPQPLRGARSLEDFLSDLLGGVRSGDYLVLMAYLEPASVHGPLQAIRRRLRDSLRVATTLGYGPRFLHSTGQLHKGGPANGVFLQVTGDDAEDLEVPGQPYTFSVLKRAQALGDFAALERRGRRVVRLHLAQSVPEGLTHLVRMIEGCLNHAGRASVG